MRLSIKLPWSIGLRGSDESSGRGAFHGKEAEITAGLKEQDLDHLGALHDAAGHAEKD